MNQSSDSTRANIIKRSNKKRRVAGQRERNEIASEIDHHLKEKTVTLIDNTELACILSEPIGCQC